MNQTWGFLRIVGSLRFAAILLVLLLFALACATVFESAHGTDQALAVFYRSRWFQVLLGLFALNVLASMVVRYPFSRKQIGFVLTHGGLLVILAGASVTHLWGVDGQLAIGEGETLDSFLLHGRSRLTLRDRTSGDEASLELSGPPFRRFEPVEGLEVGPLRLADVEATVTRYLPDADFRQRMVNDNPRPTEAVRISLTPDGRSNPVWIFAGGGGARIAGNRVSLRVARDAAELERLLRPEAPAEPTSVGTVRVDLDGKTYELRVEDCTEKPAPLGETGTTLRVLRYLPHAQVGPDKKLISASKRPLNPAVEVEITGEKGKETRVAFANFPDFQSMHGGGPHNESLKVVFHATPGAGPRDPIEILGLRGGGELHVRLQHGKEPARQETLVPGKPVKVPWSDLRLGLLEHFDRARWEWVADPVVPARKSGRNPALLLRIASPRHTADMWVGKYRSLPVSIGGRPFEVLFSDVPLSLGFRVKLDRFRVGYYPGTRRPRSFESHITITDRAAGVTLSRVVSMNHPATFGGFTLFQSSYKMGQGRPVSILSVARDPGQRVTFLGYLATIAGMFVVLAVRAREQRERTRARAMLQGPSQV